MAVGHIGFEPNSSHGRGLDEAVSKLEAGRDGLRRHVATLIQMKDAGSLGTYAVEKYGFPTPETATAALAEMEAALGALNGIEATLNQFFARFR